VTPCRWYEAWRLADGLLWVCGDDFCLGCLNTRGETVLPCLYDQITYENGHILTMLDGRLSVFDREGNPIQ
jgi:hypothetical protein